ncbi:MAG: N6-L-threonylcarbamoyladenine synthase [Limisphaerales bacterium]
MLLAVESSCDETSVAVIHAGRVLANVVASQIKLHAEYGGVVPELATREHLRNFLPTARAALEQAQITPSEVEVVAATVGPGLPQALMMGARAAQGFAFALQRPFVGMHHHEAHLYSPWIEGDPATAIWDDFVPNISLIVSGGHTLLVHVKAIAEHEVLGGTLDDAAGECFDKTAKLMGLPYPGGPVLDRLAEEGDPIAYKFPRPLLKNPGFDFSFSGLKTSVRYFLRDNPATLESDESVKDLCASIRAAIVEVLVAKTIRAAKQLNLNCVTASGGVSCNLSLRRSLAERCEKFGINLRIAQPKLCTDNAAMVGMLAERKWQLSPETTPLDCDVNPGWQL